MQVVRAKESGLIHGIKLYPAGSSVNSNSGVHGLAALDPILSAMAEVDMPLLIYGEVASPFIDVFDRERVFIETQMPSLVCHRLCPCRQCKSCQIARHPNLRIVLEHITTKEAVDFVLYEYLCCQYVL
jgi:dihydroorotase